MELNEKGLPIKGSAECFVKRFTYYDDDRNLLESEQEGNRKTVYHYLEGTNLLSSKFLLVNDQIVQREFRTYDSNGSLIRLVVDDGRSQFETSKKGLTERHISCYQLTQSEPYGLAEKIEEKVFDPRTNSEITLKTILQTFSKEGKLFKQDHYDAAGSYCFTLEWQYDPHGNVISETNALGEVTLKEYDANDNLIREEKLGSNFYRHYVYDFSNRLIRKEEVHNDGTRVCSTYAYDLLGNIIKACDPLGNATRYKYDEFNRCISISYPRLPDETGHFETAVIYNKYDIFGNITGHKDQRGNITQTSYTTRGQPVETRYPDGSKERREYNLNGTLKQITDKNGSKTIYSYDARDRIIKTEVYSKEDALLSSTSCRYNTFHQISFKDAEGVTTYYSYDLAGRLSKEVKGVMQKTYEYDSLGRLWKCFDWFGNGPEDYSVKMTRYDFLNRITEERIEDAAGKLLSFTSYSYDIEGNKIETVTQTEKGLAIGKTEYNCSKLPIKTIDSEGNLTQMFYDYSYVDRFGKKVLKITTVDPLGNQTVTIMNRLNKPGAVIHLNGLGETVAKKELFYDKAGNCSTSVETVITPNAPDRKITTKWNYDPLNNVTEIIEAFGTAEEKRTQFLYNQEGQKEKIIKPDGTIIYHTYDSLGRLQELKASDNTLSYSYKYDKNSNLIEVLDQLTNERTIRTYDQNGRMISEILGNGLKLCYSYDRQGRKIRTELPDHSAIIKEYDALFLKKVLRQSLGGELLYSHAYEAYDLSGNLLSSRMIGDAGAANYSYDLNS